MKQFFSAILLLISLNSMAAIEASGKFNLFSSVYFSAQDTPYLLTHEKGQFALKRLETQLQLKSRLNDKLSWHLQLDLFASGGTLPEQGIFNESTWLSAPVGTEQLDLSLFEGYLKIEDFAIGNLDLTVGRQRISWGTADKVGVVDNLNPLDVAQFFTFSPQHFFERRPQNALNFEYYFGNREKLQGVLLLQKQIGPLPFGFNQLQQVLNPAFSHLQTVSSWDGDKLSNLNWGLRFSTNTLNIDWGLSFYRGNLHFAYPWKISPHLGSADFIYTANSVLGVDLTGEIAGAVYWAEAALSFPEPITGTIEMTQFIENTPFTILLAGDIFSKRYLKYVLGADYRFNHGIYLNVQYLHGFFDEVGYSDFAKQFFQIKKGLFFGDISDYLFGRIEIKFANDKFLLKLSTITELMRQGTWALFPEFELALYDNFKLQGGMFLPLGGDRELSRFAFFKHSKQAYLMFKVEF